MLPNPYGYYDPVRRVYVITRPDTPTPWINYLGAGHYGGIVSNNGGGFSFDRDPRNRRVTRYRYNAVPLDQPGRYVYLRDQDTGEYWSPTWQPVVSRALEGYECRHGAGFTEIASGYGGIFASLLYFVPPGTEVDPCPLEVWRLRLENRTGRERRLRTFSYAEFSFWDANIDLHNLDWGMHILHSRCEDGIILTSTQFRPTTTFFASSRTPIGHDTGREAFVGPYRDLSNPLAVVRGESGNSLAARGNNIGSLCHEVTLAPGKTWELAYLLGVTDVQDAIPAALEPYRQPNGVQAAFEDLRQDWDAYLAHFTVRTPEPAMDAMLNFWNPVQCRTTLYWSRFVSAYETGLGRGIGVRDTAQDTLGAAHAVPGQARDMLSSLWRLQFQDGHTWHQFFPLTGEGGPGLAGEFPEWPQWFCDDALWLVIAVVAYLRETGDFAYLDEPIPYWDGGEPGTVWDHLQRAMDFTQSHLGPHGLPRLGFSDWDDTMNLDHGSGKAESVWCAQQFCRAALDMADLCSTLSRWEQAETFRRLHQEMARRVQAAGWDGAWYGRAFDDDGAPVGFSASDGQQLALNPQTWAVIGAIGAPERQAQAMHSAHDRLNSPNGLRLLSPPYSSFDARVRGTATYPPGAKENGGIFCHANAWAIVAAAGLGWGDRAYEYYRQILPLARQDADVYSVEPYVYCQNICAPEHPQAGLGRNSWLTGTAAWTYVAGTQWLLGIRPEFTGLRIAPAIPESWPGFQARRVFRGVTYNITVTRRGPGNVIALTVDGLPVAGNVVPFPAEGQRAVTVEARLGENQQVDQAYEPG